MPAGGAEFGSPPSTTEVESPIGNAVMDTRVLKEPRGFMRCLEWLFAIIAFATCCDFASQVSYKVTCQNEAQSATITHPIYYPFQLDHIPGKNGTCGTNHIMQLSADVSTDAQFFVFTGVLTFLGSMASLVIYVFFSEMYLAEHKKGPMFDFYFTAIVAVFWLSASAAWANGVITMKSAVDPDIFLFGDTSSICHRESGAFTTTAVKNCTVTDYSNFKKANVSIIVGFLNFFLWASNLWFLYKETTWFSGSGSQPQPQQQPA